MWVVTPVVAFPVVIVPVLTVNVGLDGSVHVGVSTGVTQEATLTAGVNYDGNWNPVSVFSNTFEFRPPTLSASLDFKGYAGAELALMLYGIAGAYADTNAYLQLEADINITPWWKLYGGLEVLGGVQIEILSHTLADYEVTLIDYRVLLAQAESDTPVIMDQVCTADYWGNLQGTFRPGEAIHLVLVATNHGSSPINVTYDWDTYDPTGVQVSYLSWDGFAVSMSPGQDVWHLARGIAADALLGTYTYNASVSYASGTSADSTPFVVQGTPVSTNLLEALTCKDVENVKPVDETDTFTTDDDYVYAWTAWEGASGAHTVRWEWHRPDGSIHFNLSSDFEASESLWYTWAWLYTSYMNDYGEWYVNIYMDGSYVTTLYFTFEAGIPPTSRNEPQAFTLGATGASGTWSPILQPVPVP